MAGPAGVEPASGTRLLTLGFLPFSRVKASPELALLYRCSTWLSYGPAVFTRTRRIYISAFFSRGTLHSWWAPIAQVFDEE